MQKVSELKEPPVVGKFYLVECALYEFNEWIPIVGPQHSDPELSIDFQHYHKDIRFISDRAFVSSYYILEQGGDAIEMNRSLRPDLIRSVQLKRRKCVREMPDFPVPQPPTFKAHSRPIWKKFEREQIGRKVLCDKCPHKGMPLESLPKDEKGYVICNGHGLKIDMNKGEVIKR